MLYRYLNLAPPPLAPSTSKPSRRCPHPFIYQHLLTPSGPPSLPLPAPPPSYTNQLPTSSQPSASRAPRYLRPRSTLRPRPCLRFLIRTPLVVSVARQWCAASRRGRWAGWSSSGSEVGGGPTGSVSGPGGGGWDERGRESRWAGELGAENVFLFLFFFAFAAVACAGAEWTVGRNFFV
ncbi:hypothetical protein BDY21DRAFT_347985 [Lineolata rhizophorae]|uniref:Uncharacterized protein n=1 Tax=Lineolata rhizophorae TaxID=578093 RepID=A0A6A6NY03_9PEZI|nr:hypothetical protein BDY21DRAFT_347985 [Lineolata rhizophorae]